MKVNGTVVYSRERKVWIKIIDIVEPRTTCFISDLAKFMYMLTYIYIIYIDMYVSTYMHIANTIVLIMKESHALKSLRRVGIRLNVSQCESCSNTYVPPTKH